MQNTVWRRWTLVVVACLGAQLGARAAAPAGPEWVFQHGETPPEGTTWEGLGGAYLGRQKWVDVGTREAPRATSRLVVGKRTEPVVAELLAALGIDPKLPVVIDGGMIDVGIGLVITAPDPDGAGRVALFCGEDSAGVFQTFTRPVNLLATRWQVVRGRQVIRKGDWPPLEAVAIDRSALPVLRLDRRVFEELERYGPSDEGLLIAARSVVGHAAFFEAALGPGVDLFSFYRRLFGADRARVEEARKQFAEADLAGLVSGLYAKARQALGDPPGAAPMVVFLIGDPTGTNARTYGFDPVTGRVRIMINVVAHSDLEDLAISVAHELVHSFQTSGSNSLANKAAREGVATFLSGQLTGEEDPATLLMWSPEKLAAAGAHRAELVAAFAAAREQPAAASGDWLVAGRSLAALPGAPDRSGYYLGYLAARDWRAEHPDAPFAELLALPAQALFAGL